MLQEVYFGYYVKPNTSKILLAISKRKKILRTYLENHRGLLHGEYVIDQVELDDSDLILKYEDYTITEYERYYIPNIDQLIIEYYARDIDTELLDTIQRLTHLAAMITNIKTISLKEENCILDSIRTINGFRGSPKVMKKLNKEYALSHSILYSDIQEYLSCVRQFKEMRDYEEYYKGAVIE